MLCELALVAGIITTVVEIAIVIMGMSTIIMDIMEIIITGIII